MIVIVYPAIMNGLGISFFEEEENTWKYKTARNVGDYFIIYPRR